MTTQIGVGISKHRDPRQAAREAVAAARADGAPSGPPGFVLMFATVGYDQGAIVAAVRHETGGAPLCGCSAEGVIAGSATEEANFAIAVLLMSSEEIGVRQGMVTGLADDAERAGRTIAAAIAPDDRQSARALMLFPDGLTLDFDGVARGIEDGLSLGRPLPLLGGTAADNWRLEATYQYCDDTVAQDAAAWAVLIGDANITSAIGHGCEGLGIAHEITRCEGTTIHELDGRPALEVIAGYMAPDERDNWALTVGNMPIGFEASEGSGQYIVRVMLGKDDATGSIRIATRVTEGARVWMLRRQFEQLASGVGELASELTAQLGDRAPKLLLQFECAGRGTGFLREEQRRQLQRQLRESLPAAPLIGFYTFGEIGPIGQENGFHNYTSVVAAIY